MEQAPARVVAQRMKQLRKDAGFSAEQLAAEMTKLGVPWRREVVTKIENGNREKLDVTELLALATILHVPPTALLVDPKAETASVTPEVSMDTTHVLLWHLAEQPLHGMASTWMNETIPMRLVRRLREDALRCHNARAALELFASMAEQGKDVEQRRRDNERELRRGLRALGTTINDMRDHGMHVPQLHEEESLREASALYGIPWGKRPKGQPLPGGGELFVLTEDD